jgi:RNA polymerase sigma-70 factor (ECF subfamily)
MQSRSRSCADLRAASPTAAGISYRILGAVADAEDVLQDAWLRWSTTDAAQVNNPEAFLTTVVSRLSLDRLRRVKARREVYQGPWLPEPVLLKPIPRPRPHSQTPCRWPS